MPAAGPAPVAAAEEAPVEVRYSFQVITTICKPLRNETGEAQRKDSVQRQA